MKVLATLCGTALLACSLTACNQAPPPAPDTHDADVKAISDLEAQWNKDYAAKDAEKITANYADDAVLMVPGGPATKGKPAIGAALKQMVSDPAMALSFSASRVEVAKSGDLGYTQGAYKLTVTDPMTHKIISDHGSYVTTYRKQADGSWKAVADIAVSEVPPPAPPKHK